MNGLPQNRNTLWLPTNSLSDKPPSFQSYKAPRFTQSTTIQLLTHAGSPSWKNHHLSGHFQVAIHSVPQHRPWHPELPCPKLSLHHCSHKETNQNQPMPIHNSAHGDVCCKCKSFELLSGQSESRIMFTYFS